MQVLEILWGWLNYFIGRMGNPYWLKLFGASLEKIDNWKKQVKKYGYWMALFSWLPLIGDILGIALGFLGELNSFIYFYFPREIFAVPNYYRAL